MRVTLLDTAELVVEGKSAFLDPSFQACRIEAIQSRMREDKEKDILINANIMDAAAEAVVTSDAWIGSWWMKGFMHADGCFADLIRRTQVTTDRGCDFVFENYNGRVAER